MDEDRDSPDRRRSNRCSRTDDASLAARVADGDPTALRLLMDRYDRLVRYVVFRSARKQCVVDPAWLDSVASETWTGFVQSVSRKSDNLPTAVGSYLAQIARNRAISELRRTTQRPPGGNPESPILSLDDQSCDLNIRVIQENLVDELSRMEFLGMLRECVRELDAGDLALLTQLGRITERRWVEAAGELGCKESTLRSRWKALLSRLRACVNKKTGGTIAP